MASYGGSLNAGMSRAFILSELDLANRRLDSLNIFPRRHVLQTCPPITIPGTNTHTSPCDIIHVPIQLQSRADHVIQPPVNAQPTSHEGNSLVLSITKGKIHVFYQYMSVILAKLHKKRFAYVDTGWQHPLPGYRW